MSFDERPLWLVERTNVKVESPSAGDLSNDFCFHGGPKAEALIFFLFLTKLLTLVVQVEPMPIYHWVKEISTVGQWIVFALQQSTDTPSGKNKRLSLHTVTDPRARVLVSFVFSVLTVLVHFALSVSSL